jgi:hypothetical protein
MLIRYLKYNSSVGYLLIPLVALAFWWPQLKSDTYQAMTYDYIPMPLYEMVTGFITPHLLASRIVAMVLLMLSGFYLLSLSSRYSFLSERTLLPSFFFILIVSSIPSLHRLHPVLIAALFFLPAIDKLLASYKTDRLSYNYFDASFLISAGSLFYFNLIYFIIVVWIALLILRPVIWREWALSVMGLVTPWAFFLLSDYILNDSINQSIGLIVNNVTTSDTFRFVFLGEKIIFSALLVMIILASRTIVISMGKMRVLTRKIFVLLFWVFLLVMVIFVFIETANIEIIVLSTIPVSFLLSHYLLSLKPNWSNIILWAFLAGMLIIVRLPVL